MKSNLSVATIRRSHRVPPTQVYRIWRMRDRVELEAADLFARTASEIESLRGPDDAVAKLCAKADADEKRHSVLCREILATSPDPVSPEEPTIGVDLGPKHLSRSERVLFSSVAMGCVTETLSTALLIQMRDRANSGRIRDTIHEILKDEVLHSRIGWAELGRAVYNKEPVAWLRNYIPAMVRTAIAEDIEPMVQKDGGLDLSPWGILPRKEAKAIMQHTIDTVVLPGLQRFGL